MQTLLGYVMDGNIKASLSFAIAEGNLRNLFKIHIAAPVGTPVRPVAAGRVIFSGSYQGFGRIVAIQHGKHMSSLYAHFEDLRVAVGQLVHRETVLGVVGSSGRATGPHLHFEVRVAGTPVDPSWVF